MSHWISVKERKPENYQEVLVYAGYGHVEQVTYTKYEDFETWVDWYSEFHSPEYWMPTPKKPEGAEN